jgi:hypothetical protein
VKLPRLVRAGFSLAGTLALGLSVADCNQQSVEAKLRSLEASGDATYVCVGHDPRRVDTLGGGDDRGMELSRCPDPADPPTRKMVALVTQTATNEVAVVDLVHQKVVDEDPGIPGFTFLRLPSRPGSITSTPGGEASFVGLTSPGKTGISAIPSTCLGPPRAGEAPRDLTTFAACSLPVAPGEMVVVVEPPADGPVADNCAEPLPNTDPPVAATRSECMADLPHECGPRGTRKLLVALPDLGQLALIDAQELLDRDQGSFQPCRYQAVDLKAEPDASGQAQRVPDDLRSDACTIQQPVPPPVPVGARPRPSGLSLSDDGRLYVGDLGVPLVHVFDASVPSKLKELPPLLPMSFVAPWRQVRTSRVVVSPLTPRNKRYVYAVDATDQPTTSVMAFDVSSDSADRTPLVRDGSARQPREVPDRISFGAPVQDIDFAYRDLPRESLDTGVAEIGVECDPDPGSPTDPPSPGVQERTSSDYQQGARPHFLRGLFGMAMLTNGQVVVIDVDDLDAPCRRPLTTNPESQPDFRGCHDDHFGGCEGKPECFLTLGDDGTSGAATDVPTVSNEVSCNMVQPHRARAAGFGVSLPTVGLGAPALRALPQLTPPASVNALTPSSRPKLLAVPFAGPTKDSPATPPVVYVGTTLYSATSSGTPLRVNPSDTSGPNQNSVALPLIEPRSYVPSEGNRLAYEGRVFATDRQSGFLDPVAASQPGALSSTLSDSSALFCNSGTYDVAAMTLYAEQALGLKGAEAQLFGALHADYVQITGDFPAITDPYWASAAAPADGRRACIEKFEQPPRPGANELSRKRDLLVLEAYQDHVVLAPRPSLCSSESEDFDPIACAALWTTDSTTGERTYVGTPDDPEIWRDLVACFPGGLRYTVRGSNQWVLASGRSDLLHDVVADPAHGYRCIRDCDPRRQYFRGRAFEIGQTSKCSGSDDACGNVWVGAATDADGPCRYDATDASATLDQNGTRGVALTDDARVCIFENLTGRFAVYRGLEPSVRDMTFSWDTTGGYAWLSGSLAAVSSAVLPQRVKYIAEYQALGLIDAASLGVSLMSLDSLRIADPWPVY